jgi:hypothetical protein
MKITTPAFVCIRPRDLVTILTTDRAKNALWEQTAPPHQTREAGLGVWAGSLAIAADVALVWGGDYRRWFEGYDRLPLSIVRRSS